MPVNHVTRAGPVRRRNAAERAKSSAFVLTVCYAEVRLQQSVAMISKVNREQPRGP